MALSRATVATVTDISFPVFRVSCEATLLVKISCERKGVPRLSISRYLLSFLYPSTPSPWTTKVKSYTHTPSSGWCLVRPRVCDYRWPHLAITTTAASAIAGGEARRLHPLRVPPGQPLFRSPRPCEGSQGPKVKLWSHYRLFLETVIDLNIWCVLACTWCDIDLIVATRMSLARSVFAVMTMMPLHYLEA